MAIRTYTKREVYNRMGVEYNEEDVTCADCGEELLSADERVCSLCSMLSHAVFCDIEIDDNYDGDEEDGDEV